VDGVGQNRQHDRMGKHRASLQTGGPLRASDALHLGCQAEARNVRRRGGRGVVRIWLCQVGEPAPPRRPCAAADHHRGVPPGTREAFHAGSRGIPEGSGAWPAALADEAAALARRQRTLAFLCAANARTAAATVARAISGRAMLTLGATSARLLRRNTDQRRETTSCRRPGSVMGESHLTPGRGPAQA
jgi:hypothetical protein